MNSCYTLYSGSSGNSVFLDLDGHKFLVDAGKSARSLCNSLLNVGADISDIEAIFITHEHTDHIGALAVLTKKYHIPVHVCGRSVNKLKALGEDSLCRCIIEHPPVFNTELGKVKISSFVTPHDSMESVGYRIEYPEGENDTLSLGIATDIGHVNESIRAGLLGCRDIILESNHDIDMLMCGPYPQHLKMRILSRTGHLSNSDCAAFAAELCEKGTKNILLAHLSEENNQPELALSEVTSAVAKNDVHIAVADRESPVRLF